MHKFNVKPPAHIHLKWTIFLYSKFLISLAEMLCLWFVWSSVYLNRGRQRADDSQPWDLPPYGQHPEWHGGLGEDDPKGHLGSFWWRLVYMQEFSVNLKMWMRSDSAFIWMTFKVSSSGAGGWMRVFIQCVSKLLISPPSRLKAQPHQTADCVLWSHWQNTSFMCRDCV